MVLDLLGTLVDAPTPHERGIPAELRVAVAVGMAAVAVRSRGRADALAFGNTDWPGQVLDSVEQVPAYLAELV